MMCRYFFLDTAILSPCYLIVKLDKKMHFKLRYGSK